MPEDTIINSSQISIIVPLYNHQHYIGDCLNSIFQQTYPNLEVILIDDGSTDRSGEIAEEYLQECPFPYQFIQQENQGAHAAINRGIKESSGEYIAILNSDDKYHPQRIKTLVQEAIKTSARFLYTSVRHIDSLGNPLPSSSPHRFYYHCSLKAALFFPNPDFELLRHNTSITTGNFFFHRSLAEEIGPFSNLVTCHDWDYLLRALLIESPKFVNQTLLDYRVHPENTLQKQQAQRKQEIDQVLSAYLEKVGQARNLQAPGPKVWGSYWPIFVDVYLKHLNIYPRTWQLFQEGKNVKGASRRWLVNHGIRSYQKLAEKGFNQFIWQERETQTGNTGLKMQALLLYNYLLRWFLGRAAWILGKIT